MALWNLRRSLMVSGEVLVIRLNVRVQEQAYGELWEVAESNSGRLRGEMSEAVHRHLGPEFDIRSMSFARGSLEILVVLGTLYYAVSRYKNFIESVALLLAQLKNLVLSFFEQRLRSSPLELDVQASWAPGPGLVQALPRASGGLIGESPALIVWYLIISHAAMLTVILWLLIRGLRL